MNKGKVLVLDDEVYREDASGNIFPVRKEIYDRLLKDYDIKYCESTTDFYDSLSWADLLVMDVCLKYGSTAIDVIKDWQITKKPIVLLTGQAGLEEDVTFGIPDVYREYKNIIGYINWNKIASDDNELERTKADIHVKYNSFLKQLGNNEKASCTILHLSDLQFGGNADATATNDDQRIANTLRDDGICPDILVFTGDIADKASNEEYATAKKWIENLAKQLWGLKDLDDEYRKRIVLVPGNHDYLISASAVDLYEFDFDNKIFIKKEDKGKKKKKEDVKFPNQKMGFYNFVKFAYELTKDDMWLSYLDKMITEIATFKEYGVGIVLLNTVFGINSLNCISDNGDPYFTFDGVTDDQIRHEGIINNQLVNIIVMHNPPGDLFPSGKENDLAKFETIVKDNKILLCLHGHEHSDGECYFERGKIRDLLCVAGPTARLSESSRRPDARRGFNVIKIYDEIEKEKECKVLIDLYEIKGTEFVKKHEKYKKENGKMSKIEESIGVF